MLYIKFTIEVRKALCITDVIYVSKIIFAVVK